MATRWLWACPDGGTYLSETDRIEDATAFSAASSELLGLPKIKPTIKPTKGARIKFGPGGWVIDDEWRPGDELSLTIDDLLLRCRSNRETEAVLRAEDALRGDRKHVSELERQVASAVKDRDFFAKRLERELKVGDELFESLTLTRKEVSDLKQQIDDMRAARRGYSDAAIKIRETIDELKAEPRNCKFCSKTRDCEEKQPSTCYICTREKGHEGDHVACGTCGDHILSAWS